MTFTARYNYMYYIKYMMYFINSKIREPNTTGSYAMLFFRASDFTSITIHIHIWTLFLLWFCLFILSGVTSALFSKSILSTYKLKEFIF